jgi:hypothetical protein
VLAASLSRLTVPTGIRKCCVRVYKVVLLLSLIFWLARFIGQRHPPHIQYVRTHRHTYTQLTYKHTQALTHINKWYLVCKVWNMVAPLHEENFVQKTEDIFARICTCEMKRNKEARKLHRTHFLYIICRIFSARYTVAIIVTYQLHNFVLKFWIQKTVEEIEAYIRWRYRLGSTSSEDCLVIEVCEYGAT